MLIATNPKLSLVLAFFIVACGNDSKPTRATQPAQQTQLFPAGKAVAARDHGANHPPRFNSSLESRGSLTLLLPRGPAALLEFAGEPATDWTETTVTLEDLTEDTYEIQVRANNSEGSGAWSPTAEQGRREFRMVAAGNQVQRSRVFVLLIEVDSGFERDRLSPRMTVGVPRGIISIRPHIATRDVQALRPPDIAHGFHHAGMLD